MIDASEAISFLVGTSGNAKLAALRASQEKGVEISEAQLMVAVSSDPMSMMMLATQTRILMLLRVIDTLRVTEMAYLESLDNLSAKDTAHTYVSLLKAVGGMIDGAPQPQNNNTMAAVLAGLPPQMRESVQFLLSAVDPASSGIDTSPTVDPRADSPLLNIEGATPSPLPVNSAPREELAA